MWNEHTGSRWVFFFSLLPCISFIKKRACSLELVLESCRAPSPPFPPPPPRWERDRMSTDERPPKPAVLYVTFTFPRDAGGKLSKSEKERVGCFCFSFFPEKVFQTKIKPLCSSLNLKTERNQRLGWKPDVCCSEGMYRYDDVLDGPVWQTKNQTFIFSFFFSDVCTPTVTLK